VTTGAVDVREGLSRAHPRDIVVLRPRSSPWSARNKTTDRSSEFEDSRDCVERETRARARDANDDGERGYLFI